MDSLDKLSRLANDGHDIETCRYCDEPAVVAVLDQRIGSGSVPGNKYRRRCLACTAWNPMTSADYFDGHPFPHVLPAGGDPDDPDALVPLADYDKEDDTDDRLADLQARLDADPNPDDPFEDVETDAEYQAATADETDANPRDSVAVAVDNRFNCDNCDAEITGFPDDCYNCGARFRWTPDQRPEDSHA